MNKPAGKCIFCRNGNLSKEHIFADWLHEYLPRTRSFTDHRVNHGLDDPYGRKDVAAGKLANNGDPLSRKLRVVCASCNNGWMSRLQILAKPILLPFVLGKWRALDANETRIIANWITMFTMVIEFADPATAVVPVAQRELFAARDDDARRPPMGWRMWIGLQEGNESDFYHFGVASINPAELLSWNWAMITTFFIGRLTVQAVRIDRLYPQPIDEYPKILNLVDLWPRPAVRPRAPGIVYFSMQSSLIRAFRNEIVGFLAPHNDPGA